LKLHCYGIQGTADNWFRSYLTNRKQKIEIKSLRNFPQKGNSKTWSSPGVNFRAFAFHYIYINDLPTTINTFSEPILFTDDTSVIFSSKNFDDFSTM
jgi:hypothetical protein